MSCVLRRTTLLHQGNMQHPKRAKVGLVIRTKHCSHSTPIGDPSERSGTDLTLISMRMRERLFSPVRLIVPRLVRARHRTAFAPAARARLSGLRRASSLSALDQGAEEIADDGRAQLGVPCLPVLEVDVRYPEAGLVAFCPLEIAVPGSPR
jgi:hypothetical protein